MKLEIGLLPSKQWGKNLRANKAEVTTQSTAAVIAPVGTLTGATLAPNVLASSLTSLGTLTSLGLSGAIYDTQAIDQH